MSNNKTPDPLPRITIWNEFWYEKNDRDSARIYPDGMHATIARPFREAGFSVHTATQDEPQHGLTDAVLKKTDVLIWWGHRRHEEVSDEVVASVQAQVHAGMGLIVLHSGHFSKLFRSLMGTPCTLNWRIDGHRERIWVIAPNHPIAAGLPAHFEIEHEEAYGEVFEIPPPDELVLISWFRGGEVFRTGCCFNRGRGRIFYFRPGHETYPTYHDSNVQKVIVNAACWAAPAATERRVPESVLVKSLEAI